MQDFVLTRQFPVPIPLCHPWIAACQASLYVTNPEFTQTHAHWVGDAIQPSHLLMSPSLLSLVPPSIRVFSNESTLHIRWPSIGVSASASVLPMNTQDLSLSGWTGWIALQSKGLSRVFSNTVVKKHQFFGSQLSSQSNPHIHTWPLEKP